MINVTIIHNYPIKSLHSSADGSAIRRCKCPEEILFAGKETENNASEQITNQVGGVDKQRKLGK